jgi:hypothetical protein
MSTISQELERTAHDITTAPSFRDSAEIAIAGGALGALLGYLKTRSKSEAIRLAWWGAGIGIAGQYMVFHMLKPAMKQFGRSAMTAARFGGGGMGRHMTGAMPHPHMHFGRNLGWQQQLQQPPCPIGFVMSPITGQCVPLTSPLAQGLGGGLGGM